MKDSRTPPFTGMNRSITGGFTPSALPPGVVRPGNKLASLSYHQSSVKTKIQVQYFIGCEIYTLETEKGYGNNFSALPGQSDTAAKNQSQRARVNIRISRAAARKKIMTEAMFVKNYD